MSDDRKDLPPVSATNFLERVRETVSVYLGVRGDLLDRGVTVRDLVDAGIVSLRGGAGRLSPISGAGPAISTAAGLSGPAGPAGPPGVDAVYEEDLTPPPTPTNFTATASLSNLLVECDPQLYSAGNGHLVSVLYGATWVSGALPTFGGAVEITQFPGTVFAYPTTLGTTWHLWLKWQTADGVLSTSPAGGTNGVVVTTGKIGNADLGPLIIEAGNLASGAVTAAKLAAQAVEVTKFASGIEPVTIVSSVPGVLSTRSIFNTTDGKLYRWIGSAYVASIPTADLTGQVSDAQIAGLAASKVTGTLTNAQIADLAATKITGTLVSTQIANAAITTAKFAAGIAPVEIVATLPSTGNYQGRTAFLTTDNKLYRHTGSAWVSAVPSTDITGTLTDAQIAAVAASKVTGTLTNAQIADLAAAKITGTLTNAQIADLAAAKITGTLTNAQIADLASTKITGTLTNAQIADLASTKITGTLTNAQIADLAATKITGTLTNAQIADLAAAKITGQIVTIQIVDNAITTAKFASTIEPVTLVTSVPGTKSTSSIFNTTDGKMYRWSGTAYVATVAGSDITGTVPAVNIGAGLTAAQITSVNAAAVGAGLTAAQISSVNASAVGAGLTAAQISSVNAAAVGNGLTGTQIAATTITGANMVAGTVTASQIAAGTITGANIAATTITGAKMVANTITAGQIAAGTITGTQIAATTITGSNMVANTVTAGQIAANTITASQIAANTITAGQIAANTITASQIATDTITAGQIAAGAITASEVAAGAITTAKIAASAVTAGEIASDAVTAAKILAGSITTAKIAAGAVTAGEIAADAVTAAKILAGSVTTAKIAAGAVTATEIAAGSITTTKIAANAVTAAEILAGSITTVKIAAGAVTTNEIAANTIVAADIAAGTITATEIAASTITGAKIAAGTITASNIAADTITAGQIAAGAISASEIATGAITTAKLLISGAGPAINDDPNTQDDSAWEGGTLAIVSDTTSPTTSALRITSTGSSTLSARNFPLDAAKNYNLRIKAKQVSGTSTLFLLVAFLDSAGALLTGSAHPTGWPGFGTFHYFGSVGGTIPTSWTEYSISFGPSETAKIPAGAVRVHVGFLGNYTGSGEQRFTSIRLMEKTPADLIVDGAITTNKLLANAVTAAKIAANTITASQIAAGTITATQIAGATITGAKIAAGTIAASNITAGTITGNEIAANSVNADRLVANSITAGKIQAGAITGTEIAASAITTGKLVLADTNNLIPNPDFNTGNTAGWNRIILTGGGTITAIPASTGGVPASASTINVLRFDHTGGSETSITAGDGNFNLGGLPGGVPITVGETYTLLVEAGGTAGTGLVLELITKTAAGTIAVPGSIGPTLTSSWATYSVTFTSAVSGKLYVRIGVYAGGTRTSYVTNVRLFKRASADLIVDGAITAAKIAANALAVGTAAIQNGAIVNAMIGSLAVDDAKIAAMSVSKLTAGSLAVGQFAQSTSYTAGSGSTPGTGWRLDGNGNLEVSNATVRGTVYATAGQIGGITIDAGAVRAGQSAYDTGTGFFLGSTGNFSIGNSAGNKLTWNGTVLNIVGGGTFSGALSAATGSFIGSLTAASGTFSGTVSAGSVDFASSVGTTVQYNTPGTFTLTVPAGMTRMRLNLFGAGGGGGSGSYNTGGGAGFGGAVGSTATAVFTVTPGATYTLTVGSGGAGGAQQVGYGGGNAGAAGGSTIVTSLLTATGGAGGGTGNTTTVYESVGLGYSAYRGGNGAGSNPGLGGVPPQYFTNTSNPPPPAQAGYSRPASGGGGGYQYWDFIGYSETAQAGGQGGNGGAQVEYFDPDGLVLRAPYDVLKAELRAQGLTLT